jgi:hypothetical protein
MFPLGHRHPEWTQLRDVRNSDTGWLVASVLAVVEREAECPKLGDKQTWRGVVGESESSQKTTFVQVHLDAS